jgi:hypothetical protein
MKKKFRFQLLCIIFLLGSALSATALALSLPMTLTEMVTQANLVFVGSVQTIESEKNQAGNPETSVTFKLERTIKGEATDQVTLRFAGGRVGDLELTIPDVPKLREEQRVVILAQRDGRQYISPVVGMNQGLFFVSTEPATGRELVLTYSGHFVESTASGQMRIGSTAKLDDTGRFLSVETPELPTEKVEAYSTDPEKLVVLKTHSVPRRITDPASALTLGDFLSVLEQIHRASGSNR